MPVYQFKCLNCGEYDKFKNSTECLFEDKCPTCGLTAKRIYVAVGHFFNGMQAPNIERDIQAVRYKRNKKRKGEAYAMGIERDHERRRVGKQV